MFGGSDKYNPELPVFVENNDFQYNPNTLPQLQLFVPTGCSGNPSNYIGNEQAAAPNRSVKRCREIEPKLNQQKLQMSLNNNNNNNSSSFRHDESGHAGRVLMNPNPVSTGLRLSYEEDERNNSSITCSGDAIRGPPPRGVFALNDSLKLEIDQQREEFDHYMRRQEVNLMKGITELKHKQTVRLINSLEKGVAKKLHEKEVEIENMNRKNKELTDKIKQLTSDAQCWHYKAKYNESVANALKSNLQQVIAQGPVQAREGFGDSEVDDAASYVNFGNDGGSQNQLSKCRACSGKEVSMLLMPCRHLCLCKDCEAFADVCPVCQVTKTASVQVFMS